MTLNPMEKHINLLNEQIERLDIEDFDLKAWKSSTIVLLDRMFGEKNSKSEQINNIKYEHGSWTLRDTSGSKTNLDSCKKRGKAILSVSIKEIENFGLPKKDTDKINIDVITTAFEDELTVSQFKEIRSILRQKITDEEKSERLVELLSSYDSNLAAKIVSNLILNNLISDKI